LRSDLNKISPNNYVRITKKIFIEYTWNHDLLIVYVNLIFTRSICQPQYTSMYGQLSQLSENRIIIKKFRKYNIILYIINIQFIYIYIYIMPRLSTELLHIQNKSRAWEKTDTLAQKLEKNV
jgi:hypothetical protein